jgi:hypothetical protein
MGFGGVTGSGFTSTSALTALPAAAALPLPDATEPGTNLVVFALGATPLFVGLATAAEGCDLSVACCESCDEPAISNVSSGDDRPVSPVSGDAAGGASIAAGAVRPSALLTSNTSSSSSLRSRSSRSARNNAATSKFATESSASASNRWSAARVASMFTCDAAPARIVSSVL